MKQKMEAWFAEIFGEGEMPLVGFAPGRVNLIGEHTDYNGGHVFPCALTLGTYGAARKRADQKLRFYSMNFQEEGMAESSLDDINPQKETGWSRYVEAVIMALQKRGINLPHGLDMLVYGNIPNGSGLSSSASLEVLTGFLLRELFGFDADFVELAKIGQSAENDYVGVRCGIMDQFAIAMGKKDHAIFLNTSDLTYEYVPVKLQGQKLVIACSNIKRGLADSAYNERRQECETALSDLQEVIGIRTLGDLTDDLFESYQKAVKDEKCRKRARHAVRENARTKRAAEVLKTGDLKTFGELMNESHRSLSEDYEVTGETMDCLVAVARRQSGVFGSRITGAGFGGCTVSLVAEECVKDFIDRTGAEYKEKTGICADFYVVEIGGGPVVL